VIAMRGTRIVLLAGVTALGLALIQLPPAAGARAAAVPSDFNGDGYADLAIGVPRFSVNGAEHSGAVVLLYGGQEGLGVARVQLWSQASPGVPGTRERGDSFGGALAAANYGRSGRDDLSIGVGREAIGGARKAGMVNVLYGRTSGLASKHAQGWSQDSPGVNGTAEPADSFGDSLTP
jgi:hypothetical protein